MAWGRGSGRGSGCLELKLFVDLMLRFDVC